MQTCPSCKGAKQYEVLAHMASGGCKWMTMPCFTCGGTGDITEELQERIAAGELRRLERIGRGMSIREEAKRLGMTPYEYSQLEHPKTETKE